MQEGFSLQIPGRGIEYSTTAAKAIATNTTVQTIHARDLCCGTWLMRAIVSRAQPDSERTSCIRTAWTFLAASAGRHDHGAVESRPHLASPIGMGEGQDDPVRSPRGAHVESKTHPRLPLNP
jgi:hypothetical protein